MGDYKDVLNRLAAYRKKLGATQKQIGQELGLSQEQYSYLENGKIKITESNLRSLLSNGWNIDYLITGMEFDSSRTELDDIFSQFEDGKTKEFVMKLLAEILLEKVRRNRMLEKQKETRAAVDLLEAILKSWDDFSMILFVRERLRMTQLVMAEKVGVGIKKYRDIEKEKRFPDAELLLSFYTMSGYQPLLFLNYSDRRLMSMNMVWTMLTKKEKAAVIDFIQALKRIL